MAKKGKTAKEYPNLYLLLLINMRTKRNSFEFPFLLPGKIIILKQIPFVVSAGIKRNNI